MELSFSNYGQNREVNATDEELEMFNLICQCTEADDLELVCRSDNYVSASIGPTDVARFKFTKRAKWILLPYLTNTKIKITEPDDINELKDDLIKAVQVARNLNE